MARALFRGKEGFLPGPTQVMNWTTRLSRVACIMCKNEQNGGACLLRERGLVGLNMGRNLVEKIALVYGSNDLFNDPSPLENH